MKGLSLSVGRALSPSNGRVFSLLEYRFALLLSLLLSTIEKEIHGLALPNIAKRI